MALNFPSPHLVEDALEYALQSGPAATRFHHILQTFTNDMKQLLSTRTVMLLPSELLREIFLLACSMDPHMDPPLRDGDIMRITPVIIASVNKRWRAIILDLPLAWASIDVNIHVGIEVPHNRLGLTLSKLLHLHLNRSLPHPLSIRLRIPLRCEDPVMYRNLVKFVVLHFFQGALIPHCARWRHLCIDTCHQSPFPFLVLPFLAMPSLRLHKLETFTLENGGPDPPGSPVCEAFADATSIKHIQFKGGRMHRPLLGELQARLSRVQSIDTVVLDGFTYDQAARDLPLLYKVDKVVLSNMLRPAGNHPIEYHSSITTTVKTLTSVFGWHIDLGWLDCLVAPNLRAFEVIHLFTTSQAADGLSAKMGDLFKRSDVTKSIRRLVLRGVVMWPSELADILRSLTSLEELVLHEPAASCTVRFPDYITQPDDIPEEPHMISETMCMRMACDETIGVKLKSLELIWTCDLSVDAVLDMVEERKRIVDVRLGTLPFNRFVSADLQRMTAMKESGCICSVIPL